MTYLTGDQDEQDKVTCEDDGFFLVNKNANSVCERERPHPPLSSSSSEGTIKSSAGGGSSASGSYSFSLPELS